MRVVPWPKRLKDLGSPAGGSSRRARARLKRDVGNGIGVAPAGTLGFVRSAGNGWTLLAFEADACSCCGVKWRASRLSTADMDLVEEEGE